MKSGVHDKVTRSGHVRTFSTDSRIRKRVKPPSGKSAPCETGPSTHATPVALADAVGEVAHPALDFPVVAIGASAGALEALKHFFKAMSIPNGMAFVVVVHLDPRAKLP
jgi:chemotaxis response regulator CheB